MQPFFDRSQVDGEKLDDDDAVNVDRDEDTIRLEHERLAAEYRTESALLKKALKKSTDTSPILEEDEQETEFNEEKPIVYKEKDNAAAVVNPVPINAQGDFSIRPVSSVLMLYAF